jgi:hypothetical protein
MILPSVRRGRRRRGRVGATSGCSRGRRRPRRTPPGPTGAHPRKMTSISPPRTTKVSSKSWRCGSGPPPGGTSNVDQREAPSGVVAAEQGRVGVTRDRDVREGSVVGLGPSDRQATSGVVGRRVCVLAVMAFSWSRRRGFVQTDIVKPARYPTLAASSPRRPHRESRPQTVLRTCRTSSPSRAKNPLYAGLFRSRGDRI